MTQAHVSEREEEELNSVPNTKGHDEITKHLGDKVLCYGTPGGCHASDDANDKYCQEKHGCVLLRCYQHGYRDAVKNGAISPATLTRVREALEPFAKCRDGEILNPSPEDWTRARDVFALLPSLQGQET